MRAKLLLSTIFFLKFKPLPYPTDAVKFISINSEIK